MHIIGDVHGKINQYWKLIQNKEESIQIGDFGFKKEHDWHIENIDSNKHKILFGNHDYHPYINMDHSLGKYGISEHGFFFVKGADSIDKYNRLEGRDWFRDEEISYKEGYEAIELYEKEKPEIVLTHDCPQSVAEMQFIYIGNHNEKSITRIILEEMFQMHQPAIWIFGHHHCSINTHINNTNFICLDELETYKLY